MTDFVSLKDKHPPLDTPIIIRTNWNTYLSRLKESSLGGVAFHVCGSSHKVEVTTVTG
jgi:hypothetical protein